MQAMQLQCAAAPHPTYQNYGGRGYYGGNKNYLGQGGSCTQCWENWRGGHDGRSSSDLTYWCWTHEICDHPGTYWRTPAKGHKKNAVWCNKMSGSKHKNTWKVGSVPASNYNTVENETSFASEVLCSSIVDPQIYATIITKYDSGT